MSDTNELFYLFEYYKTHNIDEPHESSYVQ
jgi:hypothetical protein